MDSKQKTDLVNVKETYEAELAARGYTPDPAQLRAVEALERCATEWAHYKEKRSNRLKKLINHPDIPRGVYMFGGVGAGQELSDGLLLQRGATQTQDTVALS